jgi:chemotaxis protein CheZ
MTGKRYRIELSQAAAQVAAGVSPAGRDGQVGVELGVAPGIAARPLAEPGRDRRDVQTDLHAMRDAIAMTKREIASLQSSATGQAGMQRAANELDAVASATESATTTILGAVEEIEAAANMLRASGLDSRRNDHVGTILERVILLYETCNFQDVTGQRIEKVVSTLKFVEERLDTMIAAWGAGEGAPAPAAPIPREPNLVSGPGLPGDDQVSQTDIDAIFK